MEEFIEKLSSYENFGLWLMIVIIGLVILFLLILILGKKDKKVREIEETKKLQQLQNSENTFKEENNVNELNVTPNEEVKLTSEVANDLGVNNTEVNELNNDKPLEAPLINNVETPKEDAQINEMFATLNAANKEVNNEKDSLKTEEPVKEELKEKEETKAIEKETEIIKETPKEIQKEIQKEAVAPLFKEEEKPIIVENEPELKITSNDEDVNITLPDSNNELNNIQLPDIDLDSIIDDITKEMEIPAKEEAKADVKEEQKEVELPTKKEEVSVPTKEELDFELPMLKKEFKEEKQSDDLKDITEEIEIPKLNNYDLDSISGEFYNINDK